MRICQNLIFITCYILQGNNWVLHWLNCITFALIVLRKAKIVLLVCCVKFLSLVMFCFRNVNAETCVREKVGKKKDVLVETWIGTAQVFVTVGRNRLTKL